MIEIQHNSRFGLTIHNYCLAFMVIVICCIFVRSSMAQDAQQLILFLSDRSGGWKLYTVRPDGTDVTPFINLDVLHSYTIGDVALSPDQSKVVFEATADGFKYDIYWLDLATGLITTVTENNGKDNGGVRWSPDGSLIGYLSDGANGDFGELDTYNPSTGEHKLITTSFMGKNSDGTFNLVGAIRSFDWSPDSKRLVLYVYGDDPRSSSQDDAKSLLVVMNLDGSDTQIVTPENHNTASPVWDADPNFIYSDCDSERHSNICKLNLQTLELQNILGITTTLINDSNAIPYIGTMSISLKGEILFQVGGSNRMYLYANGTVMKSANDILGSNDRLIGWVDVPSKAG